MEFRGTSLNVQNCNIRREQVVQAASNRFRRVLNGRGHFDVHYLSKSMNAGIGSPGPLHFKITLEYLLSGFPDFAHYGPRILLLLPAAIPRSVIFQDDFESRHDRSLLIVL